MLRAFGKGRYVSDFINGGVFNNKINDELAKQPDGFFSNVEGRQTVLTGIIYKLVNDSSKFLYKAILLDDGLNLTTINSPNMSNRKKRFMNGLSKKVFPGNINNPNNNMYNINTFMRSIRIPKA